MRGPFSTSAFLFNTGTPPVTGTPLTFAAVVRPNSAASDQVPICIASSSHSFRLHLAATGNDFYAECDDGALQRAQGPDYTTGELQYLCGVYESSTSRTAYRNGVAGTPDTASCSPTGIDRASIGIRYIAGTDWPLDGYVAEWAMWSAALTADEVKALALGYSPLFIRPQSLGGYWRGIRGDASGNEPDQWGSYTFSQAGTVGVQPHCPVLMPAAPLIVHAPPFVRSRLLVSHMAA